MSRLRLAICVSGRGSNLGALLSTLDAAPREQKCAEIVLVLSNNAEAGGVVLATNRGIPIHILQDPGDSQEWLNVLAEYRVELVVLAGYLKLVPPTVVAAYAGRIINIHPSLLPAHGGRGMYGRRVHEAVLAAGDTESGATVHLVDTEYDRGPILGQARVPVSPDDTIHTLAARVLEAEHFLLPAAVLAAAQVGRPVPFTPPTLESA